MALSEVQLISKLQTQFMRLAEFSAAAEVEFNNNAEALVNRVLEAQTAVEYAVSRALLGDKASARIAEEKVALAEEEYALCKQKALRQDELDHVRSDCEAKLAEVKAQLAQLEADLGMDHSTPGPQGLHQTMAQPLSQRFTSSHPRVSPPRFQHGSGRVRTIGASNAAASAASVRRVRDELARVSSEFSFGAGKVQQNVLEVEQLVQHVEVQLAGGSLTQVIEGLDICFDLLWEANALHQARTDFKRHRNWQTRLHQVLKSTTTQYDELAQEAVVMRQQTMVRLAALNAAPGSSPSALHRQAEYARLTRIGIRELEDVVESAADSIAEFRAFVERGPEVTSATGQDSSVEDEQALASMLRDCKEAFGVVRKRLSHPLHSVSSLSNDLRRTPSRARNPTFGDTSSEVADQSDDSLDGDDGDSQFGDVLHFFDAHDLDDDDYCYEEPAALSASQARRRRVVQKSVLTILRARRRRSRRRDDEEETRKAKDQQRRQRRRLLAEQKKQTKRGTSAKKSAHKSANRSLAKNSRTTTRSAPGLQKQTPSRSATKITELPGLRSAALDTLGELFFPGVGTKDAKDGRSDEIVRAVMAHSEIDLDHFMQLVRSRIAAVVSDSPFKTLHVFDSSSPGSLT